MSKIIIELMDGAMLVNDPSLPPNLDTPYEIRESLAYDGGYWLSRELSDQVYIKYSDVKDVYAVNSKNIVVGGGGHKYVKLQQVQELIKLYESQRALPEWELEKYSKLEDKINTTKEFLKRNAKTKEEL